MRPKDLPKICNILIDGAPDTINLPYVIDEMRLVAGVADVHHVHIRYLNEHDYALEAHIVPQNIADTETVKAIKTDWPTCVSPIPLWNLKTSRVMSTLR